MAFNMEREEDEEDYYAILECSSDATTEEIKRSYRKLALKYHPDKCTDESLRIKHETIFKKISEAYEVLKDDDKRYQYDTRSSANDYYSNGANREYQFFNEDDFMNFFTMNNNQFHQRSMKKYPIKAEDFVKPPQKNKSSPEVYEKLKLSTQTLYLGKTLKFRLKRYIVCKNCKGYKLTTRFVESLIRAKKEYKKCVHCKGDGCTMKINQNSFPAYTYQEPCSHCLGLGIRIPTKAWCTDCCKDKVGYMQEEMDIIVPIKRGMKAGDIVRLSGKADELIDCGKTGDLIFEINEDNSSSVKGANIITRVNNNLYTRCKISLVEALCGLENKFLIETFDGRILKINTRKGKVLRPNTCIVINGEGWPIDDGQNFGDLYVQIDVEFPSDYWFNEVAEIQALKSILPSTKGLPDNRDSVKNINSQLVTDYEIIDNFSLDEEKGKAQKEDQKNDFFEHNNSNNNNNGFFYTEDNEEHAGNTCTTQ
ncbi:Xdj1p SCDLUD_001700 [Saccharomycodes ludwigii]|uniref:Xdj1p n=1 Tax=Saccharomycodes ludwigii TaxID=36035 RepID=UPI001E88D065|nr:hypothetical protein SCDLUD_001700 [Saccharomycodes ludwigii]KAH3901916.1 hypothetical protein SCDLUD_001700 [Saccharomycodes ludwigii]